MRKLFNDLGLYHFNSRLFNDSVDYFRQAFELLENDPMLLDNVASAYIELNKFREARDYLKKHLHRFADRHDLKSRYAFLQGKSGDVDAAIKSYGELFAAGFRGDEALQDYIEYLTQRDRPDEALAQVQQYLAQSGSPPSQVARRLEAMLYSAQRRPRAGGLLVERAAKGRRLRRRAGLRPCGRVSGGAAVSRWTGRLPRVARPPL